MGKGKTRSSPGGLLFVLSGSSGAGKDAVLNRMKELDLPLHRVVTATTRQQRPGEKDGTDYQFTSEAEFHDMAARGDLLESAEVYGRWYGVPRQRVKQALDEGRDVLLRVDVQGAATIRKLVPEAVLIFLASPSVEYEERLRRRSTESDTELELRIGSAEEEMRSLPIFDYIVVNRQGELEAAVSEIAAIVTAEKCRVNPRIARMR